MKRIILSLILLLTVVLPLQVNALSVSNNNLTIKNGDNQSIDLYAEVDSEVKEINFSLVYTSYDIPAHFNVESGLRDDNVGIKHKIVFSVPVSGKIKLGTISIDVVKNPKIETGSINIHSANAITINDESTNLKSQIINVTINNNTETIQEELTTTDTEDTETTQSNLLSKIESKIVNIELKKDIFEYSIKVKENIAELDLKPIPTKEEYKVEISSQKISELDDNQIIIKVNGEEKTEEYKIKVNVIEEIETQIDKEEFESSYKYKGKWITLIIIFIVALLAGLVLTKKK